ncbi:B12-binding domain-containing radical SAM protein [Patescibacteria group bacterium]|nr:B12-binding domain-containing radical SAM protein [Patescibacteria group bacterium]MBU4458367.1 B12-binding domain-containing radical SAM protein [Patescibacteria group bacterium]MCG2695878.1 B12-binding domain-containing radical SAM protein [Candidatus Portnoybacteria bacterium]
MTILLINPPGKKSLVCPPLGLAYLAATLQKLNYRVIILDYLLEKFSEEKLLKFIKKENASIIGLTAVTPNIKKALYLAEIIKKKFPEKIIILGGAHATLKPNEVLEKTESIDYVFRGEGEIRFPKLVEYILKKQNPENLPGLTFRRNKQIINTPDADFIENLDELPFPARELLNIKRYSKYLNSLKKPATTIFTSRGCPHHCIYCSKPITGTKFRPRSPENIISEIELLKNKYGIKELQFYDDTFTLDRKRVLKICQLLIENKIKIQWKCETRVNLVDKELLKIMKKAGCYLIAYGIESGSQRVLNFLKKGTTIEQIKNTVEITKGVNIQMLGYFILGIPTESEEEIKRTIKFSKELNLDYVQFAIATAYPGTELYEIAKQSRKINNDWSKSFYALSAKPLISLSDVSINKLRRYLKTAYRSFYFRPKYIWKRISSIKSLKDLLYNLRGLKILTKI